MYNLKGACNVAEKYAIFLTDLHFALYQHTLLSGSQEPVAFEGSDAWVTEFGWLARRSEMLVASNMGSTLPSAMQNHGTHKHARQINTFIYGMGGGGVH